MKVYEKCNELKGTNADAKTIADWAYMNRICPIEFEYGLEVNNYPDELKTIAGITCAKNSCGHNCVMEFLNSEVKV